MLSSDKQTSAARQPLRSTSALATTVCSILLLLLASAAAVSDDSEASCATRYVRVREMHFDDVFCARDVAVA